MSYTYAVYIHNLVANLHFKNDEKNKIFAQ